jgi:hypothetical protein
MLIRILNAFVGLWLFASALLFQRSSPQFFNVFLVGILATGLGVASILGRHGARRLNFVLGLWLFVSALAIHQPSAGALFNQIVCAVLLVITSLFPHAHYQRDRRSA